MVKKILLVCCSFLCFSFLTSPKVDAAFEARSWGARPRGLGGAFVAIADDSNAILWNPGGIGQLEKSEGSFMYAEPYTGLDLGLGYMYLNYAHPIFGEPKSAIGIAWARYALAGIYEENTFVLNYAYEVSRGFFAGANLKYLHHEVNETPQVIGDPVLYGENSKSAISFGLGVLYKGIPNFSIGLAINHLNQPDVGFRATDKVPMVVKMGVAYEFSAKKLNIIPAFSIIHRDEEYTPSAGVEVWSLSKSFGGRVGYNPNETTLGISFAFQPGIQLDYSYEIPIHVIGSDGNHNIALVLRFGGKKTAQVIPPTPAEISG